MGIGQRDVMAAVTMECGQVRGIPDTYTCASSLNVVQTFLFRMYIRTYVCVCVYRHVLNQFVQM